jgi:hypothetical protein
MRKGEKEGGGGDRRGSGCSEVSRARMTLGVVVEDKQRPWRVDVAHGA